MIEKVLTTIFGSKHERDVKRMLPVVAQINALEPTISKLTDEGLRAKTAELRERLKPVAERLDQIDVTGGEMRPRVARGEIQRDVVDRRALS